MDRRQGQFEKAIREFNEASARDPGNVVSIQELADTLYYTRQFRAAEHAFDRLSDLRPDLPMLKVRKPLYVVFYETGDAAAVHSAIAALPTSIAADKGVLCLRLKFALVDRNWLQAKELIKKLKGDEDEGWFAYGGYPVPVGCYSIMLTRIQGDQPGTASNFAETREQLNQKVQKSPEIAPLLSQLAVTDALLDNKEAAISEAKRAVELARVSKDVLDSPGIRMNLAVVYAWTNEVDLAFEELDPLTKMPFGVFYGQLKRDPYWEPLRKDWRFEKLLARLAPHQSLQELPFDASRAGNRRTTARSRPKRISVARLPVTGSDLFGREEDIAFLDRAWANTDVNIVIIVAWAGVGKSTLVNHWLRRMAAEKYRSAELVFGWSFYRQGTRGETSSADEFLDAALDWFGDPDPRNGSAWEKGERLAKLVADRRTLLVLDGLEPLQNPPGPQEGRLREPSLQALLRELAAFNKGLCLITTRTPIADIADCEGSSAQRCDLEQLSSDAGAKLVRALGVKGDQGELRRASEEFSGHCLALTLLGSYLTDAYNGDIRCRSEVSGHLAHDVRQGVHARKVMESYQTWLGEGPELSILRLLGLFDRPADEKALGALLKSPAIPGLTESLTDCSPSAWRMILGKLRRARLLAGEDLHNPGCLDAHPLVREYFGEQLRSQQKGAWKECNRRLFYYYRTLAPQLPNSFREMEPLFLAVICGCNAGLFREALHEVYIARIQRGNASFAANVLGARGALLSVLVHFFEHGRWGSPVDTTVEEQRLTAEDQLFILMQAGLCLTATRGFGSPEARICYERAESLCYSLNRPVHLYLALIGQWRHSLFTDTLTAAMEIAERVHSLAQDQNDPALLIGACRALAVTLYFMGDFDSARQYARWGVELWRAGAASSLGEEVHTPAVLCLCFAALCEWHLGEIASSKSTIAEAIALAKALQDTHALAMALYHAAFLSHYEWNPAAVERFASDLIEVSTRQNFALWVTAGEIFRGWSRSVSGNTVEALASIENGIKDIQAADQTLNVSYALALKAESLHLTDRASEALEALKHAEALVEKFGERWWCAEMCRLRGVVLAAMGANEAQIEASFCEAIRIAKEQKSISLEKRAEATCAEYQRLKGNASGGRGFRLSLC
jgi:tetratricopeptide (TPR) repeat protein